MICPFCGKEMVEGFVKGLPGTNIWKNGRLYWDTKAKMKASDFFRSTFQALALSHYDACFPAVKSYKCDSCKKIIMDTYIEEV